MPDPCAFAPNRICSKKEDVIRFRVEWSWDVKPANNETLQTIKQRRSIRLFTKEEINEVLDFLGEPKGEFMAVVPVGFAATPGQGPKKQPLEMKVRYLDQ